MTRLKSAGLFTFELLLAAALFVVGVAVGYVGGVDDGRQDVQAPQVEATLPVPGPTGFGCGVGCETPDAPAGQLDGLGEVRQP